MSGEAFAVAVDFPMSGAPTFEEAVKIGPRNWEEITPFRFDGCRGERWVFGLNGRLEGVEVVV